MGMLNSSSEAVVVIEQGMAIKTRSANIRRIPESERWDADKILGIRAVPWSPNGSDNAFDIQVGMERPAEMMPRAPGDVLMENKVARTYLRRADFEPWGLSECCPGCRYPTTGQGRQQAHSEACRRRTEDLLKGNPAGSARLAAADERINRALADAVERHATKDPGVRGILKRSSVACHPESESQKRVALDTEHDPTSQPRVSYGGSSASGVRPSAITIADQGTGTSDVARAGSEEHNDDDVAMDGDCADDDSARHPNPSGSDSRRRITTKREPREVRVEQSGTTEQHVWRRLFGKTTHQGPAVAVTTQQALDGSREKTMRIANVEKQCTELGVDFVGRPARDEMRHIIGCSEPDVIGLTGIGTGSAERRTGIT